MPGVIFPVVQRMPGRMPKQQVQSAGTRAMTAGLRQALAVYFPPVSRFQVFGVDIEDVKIGGGARCDANQRRRILPPQFAQTAPISLRLLETVRRRWALTYEAWKAEQPICSQRQRGVERRITIGAGHEPAPVLSWVLGAGNLVVVAADGIVASTGSVIVLDETLRGLPRRRGAAAMLLSSPVLLEGAITGVFARKARQSSSRMTVRRPIFLA